MRSEFYKEKSGDKVWWLDNDSIGEFVFSFDRKKTYNLFQDYPHKLSVEEWKTFNRENPYWENFFKDRNEKYKKKHDID